MHKSTKNICQCKHSITDDQNKNCAITTAYELSFVNHYREIRYVSLSKDLSWIGKVDINLSTSYRSCAITYYSLNGNGWELKQWDGARVHISTRMESSSLKTMRMEQVYFASLQLRNTKEGEKIRWKMQQQRSATFYCVHESTKKERTSFIYIWSFFRFYKKQFFDLCDGEQYKWY